jgi:hypothetical protein
LIYGTILCETKGDLFYGERRKDSSLGDPAIFLQTPFDEGAVVLGGARQADGRDREAAAKFYARDAGDVV